MEKKYIEQMIQEQEKIDEKLKQAQNQQYVEYVSTKLDDLVKYQQQENQNLKTSKQLTQSVDELVGLTNELDTRFQKTIKQLLLKQDQLEAEQLEWKLKQRQIESQILKDLEQEKTNIDKKFKERLRTIHQI